MTEGRGSIRQPPSASCPTLTRCTGHPTQVHRSPCPGAQVAPFRCTWYPVQIYMSPFPGAPSAPFRYTCHPAQVHRSLCSGAPGIRPGIHVTLHRRTSSAAQVTRSGAPDNLHRYTGYPVQVHSSLRSGTPCTRTNKILSPPLPCPGTSGTCHM